MPTPVPRPIYLLSFRVTSFQRAHLAIFVPNTPYASERPIEDVCVGTTIHVVGSPMRGYVHEFKHNYSTASDPSLREAVIIGFITSAQLPEPEADNFFTTDQPLGQMDRLALLVQPPSASPDLRGCVDGVSRDVIYRASLTPEKVRNKRCQEWTIEYIHLLVQKGLLNAEAIGIAHARRDSPSFGIGLRPAVTDNEGAGRS